MSMAASHSLAALIGQSCILASLQLAFSSFIITSLYIAKNVATTQTSINELNADLRHAIIVGVIWTIVTSALLGSQYGWGGVISAITANIIVILYIIISMRATMKYTADKNGLSMPRLL